MTLGDNKRKTNQQQKPLSLTGLDIVFSTLSAGTPETQSMTYLEACNSAYDLWVLNMCNGFLLFLWQSFENETCNTKTGIVGFSFRNYSASEMVRLHVFYSFPGQVVWEPRKHASVTCQLTAEKTVFFSAVN